MILARTVLLLSALLFAAVGSAFLPRPAEMASRVGIRLGERIASSDVRAVYGGLEIGFAFFLAFTSLNRSTVRPGLVAEIAAFGGLLLGRAVGVLTEGVPGSSGPLRIAFERLGFLLGLAGLETVRPGPIHPRGPVRPASGGSLSGRRAGEA